jgi:RNA-directed DNA polymerase
MSIRQAKRQMPASAGREAVGQGEALPDVFSDEACCPRHVAGNAGTVLLNAVLERENLQQAFKRVRVNKGAAGVDGWDIDETSRYLAVAGPDIGSC